MDEIKLKPVEEIEEKPPVFKSWRTLYWLVFLNLVLLIILFYIFTKVFE